MESKYLLEGEKIISESGDKEIVLTTHRIRSNFSDTGTRDIISIMLEKISSIEIHYKSWFLIFVIGIVFAFGGLLIGVINKSDDAMFGGLIIGGVCILFYFFTRKHVVTISSDGGSKINFQTNGMKREILLDFINKIEEAKANRFNKNTY